MNVALCLLVGVPIAWLAMGLAEHHGASPAVMHLIGGGVAFLAGATRCGGLFR